MAHIVTSKCVGCKFTDCVEVCPVACFYELDNQVVIHPEDCIDCTACVAECPVEAIYAEADMPSDYQTNIEFNATESRRLKDSGEPAIVKKKEPLPTDHAKESRTGLLKLAFEPAVGMCDRPEVNDNCVKVLGELTLNPLAHEFVETSASANSGNWEWEVEALSAEERGAGTE